MLYIKRETFSAFVSNVKLLFFSWHFLSRTAEQGSRLHYCGTHNKDVVLTERRLYDASWTRSDACKLPHFYESKGGGLDICSVLCRPAYLGEVVTLYVCVMFVAVGNPTTARTNIRYTLIERRRMRAVSQYSSDTCGRKVELLAATHDP